MTWGEVKAKVEELGLPDDTLVYIMGGRWSHGIGFEARVVRGDPAVTDSFTTVCHNDECRETHRIMLVDEY